MARKPVSEKIEGIEKEIEQLKNEKKRLLQQQSANERKKRTKRLCTRAGLIESLMPDTKLLTDEQFKDLIEKTTANDFGMSMLNRMLSKIVSNPESSQSNLSKQASGATTHKTTGAEQVSNESTANVSGNAKETG